MVNKEECCGCFACEQKCPKSCITMQTDKEGFKYPHIEKKKCINCNCCEKVCPIINSTLNGQPRSIKAYAAYHKDETIRMSSSSGGIFTALAELIINQGGVVFGAAFTEDFGVQHICVETIEKLDQLRGSKYLQSKIGNAYQQAKQFLAQGRIVLFTGTPCQIEGLISYLGKEYDNLFTQDLICHGVPSPMVWQRYIKFREKKIASNAKRVFFRNKRYGWKMYSLHFEFKNQLEYAQVYSKDLYITSFLRNWCLRPSCYSCHFKKSNRLSDITLADFWGIENVCPEMDDDKGTSLVLLHSLKGEKLWNQICQNTVYQEVNAEQSVKYNPSMIQSVAKPVQRESFLRDIRKMDFERCVQKYATPQSDSKHFINFLRRAVRKIMRSAVIVRIRRRLKR